MDQYHPLLRKAFDELPDHYFDTYSDTFLVLIAALKMHGLHVLDADEATPVIDKQEDLWMNLSRPAVSLYTPGVPTKELRQAKPGSPEHTRLTNEVIRANLLVQQRLLHLLEQFYSKHTPISFTARLVIENIDLGESNLRSQGASVRNVLEDPSKQRQWLDENMTEFRAFADWLAQRDPAS